LTNRDKNNIIKEYLGKSSEVGDISGKKIQVKSRKQRKLKRLIPKLA